jgi:hypothetical protein
MIDRIQPIRPIVPIQRDKTKRRPSEEQPEEKREREVEKPPKKGEVV